MPATLPLILSAGAAGVLLGGLLVWLLVSLVG
jgi:hypothetical protein